MAGIIEESCGELLGAAMRLARPFKSMLAKPECRVHKFINCQAVNILGNDGMVGAHELFTKHLRILNSGAVWADQDFRSSNHFYNPYSKTGLYGFSNAMRECMAFYAAALKWWQRHDTARAIFCLGAACHLIQDMTVPQHVSLDLLNNHRRFENWVVAAHDKVNGFKCSEGGIYLDSVKDYINGNAYASLIAYKKSISITTLGDRFYYVAYKGLCQAQKSTAGLLQLFYDDVQQGKNILYIRTNCTESCPKRYLQKP